MNSLSLWERPARGTRVDGKHNVIAARSGRPTNVIAAEAAIHDKPQHHACFGLPWVPAFAGMTMSKRDGRAPAWKLAGFASPYGRGRRARAG
jgi:hypothetical protein